MLTILLAVILTAIAAAVYNYKSDFWRKLEKFPTISPRYPFFGHALSVAVPREKITTVLHDLFNTFSNWRTIWFSMGPYQCIFLLHPETVQPVLAKNTNITKSELYKPLLGWLGTGLLTSTGPKWKKRRRMLTPSFHFKALGSFTQTFNREARILVKVLKKKKEVDIFPYITRCTLDIILDAVMRHQMYTQEKGDSQYATAVSEAVEIFNIRQFNPLLMIDWIFYLTPVGRREVKCLEILKSFTNQIIKTRRKEFLEENSGENKPPGGRDAFIDLLLRAEIPGEGPLSDEDIREEVDTFMFEGHDTTACSLTWTIFLLGNHPKVLQDLRQEQEDIFHDSLDRDVNADDMKEMVKLEAAIKESLRLFPSVPIMARKCEEAFEVDGFEVPVGTQLMIPPFYLHRNPLVYENPLEYRPERFLGEEADRHPFAYVPFSAGPRNCIGQRFAQMEEKVVLSHLLRNFTWESCSSMEDNPPLVEIITRPSKPVDIRLTPTNQNDDE